MVFNNDEAQSAVPTFTAASSSRGKNEKIKTGSHTVLAPTPESLRQQNALLPVHRLPHDLLLTIFSWLALPTYNTGHHVDNVVLASHVCERWRGITASPSLWTEVKVRTIAQTSVYLERSQDVSIQVTVKGVSDEVWDALPTLLEPHLRRIRVLELCDALYEADIRRWVAVLSAPAPLLESLSLALKVHGWAWHDGPSSEYVDEWPFSEEESGFGGHLAGLRSLTLYGMSFSPSSPLFTHLRHLRLSGQPPRHFRTSKTIVQILERLPHLETLSLANMGEDEHESGTDNRSFSISLPHLQEITMRGVPLNFPGNVFDAITFPATARLDLCVGTTEADAQWSLPRRPRDGVQHLPALTGVRALDLTFAIEHTSIPWCDYEYDDSIVIFRTRRDLAASAPDATLELRVRLFDRRPHRLCHTFGLFDSSTIQRLSIRLSGALPTTEWGEVLGEMPGLRALEVADCPGEDMSGLLEELARARVCPLLESVSVRGVECTDELWQRRRDVIAARRGLLTTLRFVDATGLTCRTNKLVMEVEDAMETLEVQEKIDVQTRSCF